MTRRAEALSVMRTLRGGPLGPVEIAEETLMAPFNAHGWLKMLKRERLVEEHLTSREHTFALTDRGRRELLEADQLRLV